MSTEECVLVLQSTLNEIKNVCPQVSHAFIFNQGRDILAKDTDTDETTANNTIEAFQAINKKAKHSGGLDSVSFEGEDSRASIFRVNNFYLATVSSKEADERTLFALTRVIVPTVLRLVEIIQPRLANVPTNPIAEDNIEEIVTAENGETQLSPDETLANETKQVEVPESNVDSEPLLPEPPVTQFMVENLGGLSRLIGAQDTVRIDHDVISQWANLYGDRVIDEVQVEETQTGKRARCRFKPIKDSDSEGKGIIQLPEKVQSILQTKKGALVMVKPIIK
jgi:hypothetical protein